MNRFTEEYQNELTGAISGWDRIALRGTIRWLANLSGIGSYLSVNRILLKDFGSWAEEKTRNVRAACERTADSLGIEQEYLRSSSISKEELARAIAKKRGITEGPICMLSVVEPSYSPTVVGNRRTKELEIVMRQRKCVWIYFYWNDPAWGFGHLRLQSWLPFTIKGCLNGREWLGRQLDQKHVKYIKADNAFRWIADCEMAQQLMNQQLELNWPQKLNAMKDQYFGVTAQLFGTQPLDYYWSADETEWATDLMFRSTARLDRLFPLLARHGLTITDSCNVLRFLGKIAPAAALPRRVSDGIRGDRQRRYEGIRLKHSCGRNSVKTYNKAGNVLRVETTINDPRSFKVYRRANDDPSQPLRWQNMRKGVADMQRRASLSQRSNDRYFDALASCKTDTTLLEAIEQICKKTQSHGRCVRAINPWSPADFSLLRFLAQGQWCIEGLRNRDLARWLEPDLSRLSKADRGRLSARVSRILGILKTHGLIRKVPKSHRYTITPKGSQICSMVITASTLDGQDLTEAAA